MTSLLTRRVIVSCLVLIELCLFCPAAVCDEQPAATKDELRLAETAEKFFRAWFEKADSETAANFLSAGAFMPECSSDEGDFEIPPEERVRTEYKEAFSAALSTLLDPGLLSERIKPPDNPGFPPDEVVSHPKQNLFQMVRPRRGFTLKGLVCKGSDRRPFVVQALSQQCLRAIHVQLQIEPDRLEEFRRAAEDTGFVVEFFFIWGKEKGVWKLVTMDLVRR